jgi:cell division protein FtsB
VSSVQRSGGFGGLVYFASATVLGTYFTFIAVQGDFGMFARVEILADARALTAERDRLRVELAAMENLTHRLSDEYLDLDLLDERARDILGYMRPDEVAIR